MKQISTIKISSETKSRLDKLKEYPRETYEDILRKILFILNTCRKDPDKAKSYLFSIDTKIKKNIAFSEIERQRPQQSKEKTIKENK